MRTYDWSSSPLGAVATWPVALRNALNLMLNSPESMYLVWGPALTFLFNDAYRPILGPRLDGALGQSLPALWADAWETVRLPLEKALAGEASRFVDVPMTMARQGFEEATWWSYSYSPIYEGDHVGGVFCYTMETTARIRVETALRRNNEVLEQRVEQRTRQVDRAWRVSHELLVVALPDGTLDAVNPTWTQTLGWEAHELQGARFVDYTHPDDLEATVRAFGGIFEAPLTVPYEYRLRHKDGSHRWFAWTAAFEDGKVYASGRDVTRDREREAVLRDAQDFARLALSAVGGVGVWTYEAASDRFFYDAAIAELYALDPASGPQGLPRPEFLANVHPHDRAALSARMAGGLARPGDLELEYRLCHPDGSIRWVLSRGHTYHDAKGQPVRRTGVGVDMTNQRRTEEALRQSQKMEAVGQLTGGLAHDFNNLLAGISGSLELMQNRLRQGRLNDVERYMAAAQGAARRAAALTHRLLAFSRRQTLDPKPINLNSLVNGMQELIQRTVGPAIAVEVVGASGLWPVLVDPSQLENALLNLCINARDAMPAGGRTTIETANKWLDAPAARQHDMPEGQYLSMCVTDTGTGMPPEIIDRVFEPFFTTKPIGEGTGLGLSMIYGFAQQSGGQVRIYSEVGQGTTVCIYLPRHYGEVTDAGRAADIEAPSRSEQGATVLIVDDEPTVRMIVTDILDDLGYTAIEAGDSAVGLKILQSDARIDLLVTDVGLPGGMNGRQMAEAARVTRPDLKVLFITGYAENAVIGNGQLAPGMVVLTKPFATDAMAARIRSLIEADKEAARPRSSVG